LLFCSGWPGTVVLPSWLPLYSGMTGMSHCAQLLVEMGTLKLFVQVSLEPWSSWVRFQAWAIGPQPDWLFVLAETLLFFFFIKIRSLFHTYWSPTISMSDHHYILA
jgi:hypothetical protein